MPVSERDFEQLLREHHGLMRDYARAQTASSEQLRAQADAIDALQAQAMRLRAKVVLRETALAWAKEDRAALERAIPSLPKRITLARRVDVLVARIQALMRERLRAAPQAAAEAPVEMVAPQQGESDSLEASLRAADLVICQTGCLSHGAFWRVQDHCKRTGKTCVLVEQPEALRIVRIHGARHDAHPPHRAKEDGVPAKEQTWMRT